MVKKLKNLSRKSYKYELVMSGIKNFNRKSDKNFV